MYYIIVTNYVGPDQAQDPYVDADTIEISTTPAINYYSSRAECIEGWCGTIDDWAVYAHGEYTTIEAARDAIIANFGVVRDVYPDGDPNVVGTYKPGKYAPMSSRATEEWAYESIRADIDADTTDERIAELVGRYEEEANSNGCTLGSDLADIMMARRQELQARLI